MAIKSMVVFICFSISRRLMDSCDLQSLVRFGVLSLITTVNSGLPAIPTEHIIRTNDVVATQLGVLVILESRDFLSQSGLRILYR